MSLCFRTYIPSVTLETLETAIISLFEPAMFGASHVFEEYKTHLMASFTVIPNVPSNCNVFSAFTTTVFDDKDVILGLIIGLSLFLGSALQQVALLYTDVANAAFFTIFYVPMVPIIIFIFKRDSLHWSVWPSVILCLIGGYLLTNFYDSTVRLGDTLVILGALFWSTHIIFTGMIVKKYDLPLTLGAIQTLLVALFSFIIGLIYEEFVIENILNEIDSILYAGILSGGFAFVLQIYAQKNITPAPAAIIFSLEGVFATIAAWILLSQILDFNNILGCLFILCGVLISQLLPLMRKINYQ